MKIISYYKTLKTLKQVALLISCSLALNMAYAQTPVDSVGSGCALDFDGVSDYVRCSQNNLGILNSLTVSAWVKISTSDYKWIVGKYDPGEDAGWHLCMYSGKVYWAGRDGSGTYRSLFSLDTFNDNKWHYVVGVVNNNIWKIYVDGIFQGMLNTGYNSTDLRSSAYLEIGRYWNPGWPQTYWDNQIDEVRIWNYARTQTEIQRDMCRKLTGNEPGLVGYWRFDDCGGLTATDASGNGNNGTLY